MTGRQIELVQQSFQEIKRISVQSARLFYQCLFELEPSLLPMFRGEDQGRRLMQTIGAAVGSLRRPDRIPFAIADRQAGFRVREEHYPAVGFALLWALRQGLGAAFTPEVCEAWIAMYDTVAAVMRRGAPASQAA